MSKEVPDFEFEVVDKNGNVLPEDKPFPLSSKDIDFIVKLFIPLIVEK